MFLCAAAPCHALALTAHIPHNKPTQVALHTGPTVWQQHLQGAFVQLSAAALCGGDSDVAASLLLAFPDLAAALGHEEAATILVPVVLELLHTRLVSY